ncbi:helix-turn-helix domain-containing protein [Sneathiella sp.]|uniref:helix-turn-helix domain-containing protein n=1 Tax=Sneathiella sp. TaxID=1964365 RepID=UPI002610230F|nr:RodZ domain-containing protein [Sneathiella sp.]MDF2367082.1 DUF4115 domain-containing protein [Sneathiella sp.]
MAKDSNRRDVVTQPNLFGRNASKGNRLSLKTPEENNDQPEAEDGPLSVGTQLRDAREAKGLSLHQVADILRLRASQVHALEEGNFNSLPGQTFVTGFLRSYANLLDLDAVAIVELYKNEEGGGLHVQSLAFPEPSSGGRIPGAGIMLGTFVVALILLAGWFLYQESESLDFERVAELPEHLVSKIRDLGETSPENAAGDPSVDSVTMNQKNSSESPVIAVIEAPEAKSEENTAPESENVAALSENETSSEESAATDNLEETNKTANPETELVESSSTAMASESNSAASSPEEMAAVDTSTAEDETTSASAVEAPQNPVTRETQAATVAEATEQQTTTPETPQPAPETSTSYPQDKLDTATAAQLQTADTPENPLPRTFGVENTDARVVVRATEESWIEVKATDENPVLSRVLKPGDVYMAPNEPDLILTTGNAGGLEIRVDGKEIKALGGAGTILREVPLVAESLLENTGLQ